MAKKTWFDNKARRSFWSVHIEAWQRSGLGRRKYCARHRLSRNTFNRWVKVLVGEEALRIRAELAREEHHRRPRRRHFRLSSDKRSQAVQAFWAMHVEAMTWSNMSLRDYAAALRLSRYSLGRWRKLFEADEVAIDWRAHLHPSARPRISSGVSSAAKEGSAETVLTAPAKDEPARDRRSNRRTFTDAEKLAIVLEAEQPGASVAAVCRRHDIATSMVFRWRVQFGFGQGERAKLARVHVADEPSGRRRSGADALVLHDLLPVPDGMTSFELADGRRVFAPAGSDPEAVRRYVAAQETGR